MRTQSNAVACLLGAVGTLLVGCADDSGMDVANNPVADGSMPTNVTTVTDTAVTTTTVTMDRDLLGNGDRGHRHGTSTATGTATATGTNGGTTTVTATSTATSYHGDGHDSSTSTATYSAASGYVTVVLSFPPAWNCPANASTGLAGHGTPTLPTDSTLATTDCKSLANLRRPLLKTQSQSALGSARNNLRLRQLHRQDGAARPTRTASKSAPGIARRYGVLPQMPVQLAETRVVACAARALWLCVLSSGRRRFASDLQSVVARVLSVGKVGVPVARQPRCWHWLGSSKRVETENHRT